MYCTVQSTLVLCVLLLNGARERNMESDSRAGLPIHLTFLKQIAMWKQSLVEPRPCVCRRIENWQGCM